MAAHRDTVSATTDREILLTRVFDAPRERVFEAMTDPKQVARWWGPNGFTTTIHVMDLRPGGAWNLTMHGPDGTDYLNESVYVEVVKPERIVFHHGTGEEAFESTWTFDTQGSGTRVTLRNVFASAAARHMVVKRYNAVEGGKQTLGRLGEYLAGHA